MGVLYVWPVRTKPQAPRSLQRWLASSFEAGVECCLRGGICIHDLAGHQSGRHRASEGQTVSGTFQGHSQLSAAESFSGCVATRKLSAAQSRKWLLKFHIYICKDRGKRLRLPSHLQIENDSHQILPSLAHRERVVSDVG